MFKVGKLWDSFVERRREGVFGDELSARYSTIGTILGRVLCFVFGLQLS